MSQPLSRQRDRPEARTNCRINYGYGYDTECRVHYALTKHYHHVRATVYLVDLKRYRA